MESHTASISVPALQRTTLMEVRIGKIKKLGKTDILSAIAKTTCEGFVDISRDSISGDEYGSPHLHGGAEQAILQYPAHYYARWREEFPDSAEHLVTGGFSENFVAEHFDETNMCIGDIVEVGSVRLQVSQPRQPCFRLNHRFEQPAMARRVQTVQRTGWYYRVLQPGQVRAGDELRVVERPYPEWTVARVQHFMYRDTSNVEAMSTLATLPLLAPLTQNLFKKRLESLQVEDWEARLADDPADVANTAETAAFAQAAGASVHTDTVDPALENGWMRLRVKTISIESDSVRSIVFDDVAGRALPLSTPGAHIKVKLPNGLERQYSLCAQTDGRTYKIAVGLAEAGRGGSAWLHTTLRPGDTLLVSAPINSFPIAADAAHHVMIAGGIGITPFVAMIEHFRQTGASFQLFYAARTSRSAAFVDHLQTVADGETQFHFSRDPSGRRIDVAAILASLDANAHVYCCGPAALMNAVRDSDSRIPPAHFHFEAFASDVEPTEARAFEIALASSGRILPVSATSSILEVLRAHAVDVPSSCETGSCGTCVVDYRDGDVEHHDFCLTTTQRKRQLAVCVSRARSARITLAL